MSYTVKIIDNDNGAVVIDSTNARAVVGAVATDEGAQGVFSTSCKTEEIAMCMFAAQQAIDIGKKANPMYAALLAFIETKKDELPSTVVDLSHLKRSKNGD